MKLKNKLKIYDSFISKEEPSSPPPEEKKEFKIPNIEEWKKHGFTPYIMDDQYCLIKEKRYSINEKRGIYSFRDFFTAIKAWQTTNFSHPLSAKGYEASDLFFFDTETTGLGGGTGNTIFLLGYAYLENDEVVVKQHFLPEPGYEIPLYDSFLKSVDYTTLVTYNGKAFDWPQVKTRHTLIREHVPLLPSFGHFDLLHGARRLWKTQLEKVKLSIVEKEILGIEREDDVPGYLAPIIYFDFIDSKQTDGILKVMEHNEDDVLSLMILYTHISFLLLGIDPRQTNSECLSIGQWFSSIKETERAIEILEGTVYQQSGNDKWSGMFELAIQYKKLKSYEKALPYWKQIVEGANGHLKIQASIELAKFYEHHNKDYLLALKFSEEAVEEWKEVKKNTDIVQDKIKADLDKRINRLYRKVEQ